MGGSKGSWEAEGQFVGIDDGPGEAESWFVGIDNGLGEAEGRFIGIDNGPEKATLFLAAGVIWKATILAPPEGRENFLGGGTFRRTFRPNEYIENLRHLYHCLLFAFLLHSNALVL